MELSVAFVLLWVDFTLHPLLESRYSWRRGLDSQRPAATLSTASQPSLSRKVFTHQQFGYERGGQDISFSQDNFWGSRHT